MRKYLLVLLSMFLTTLSFAEPVSEDLARVVAQRWMLENHEAFGDFGSVTEVIAERGENDTILWWYVVMSDGGAIITAPDTRIEPVITVMDSYDGGIPENHPLRVLLTRDIKSRLASADALTVAAKMKFASSSVTTNSLSDSVYRNSLNKVVASAEDKWARFSMPAKMKASSSVTIRDGDPAMVVGVAAGYEKNGVFTHWNQDKTLSFANNSIVYNKYTPNNYDAGCVATAAASLLQYFNLTNAPDPQVTRNCVIDSTVTSLTTINGNYDWSILPVEMGGKATGFNGTLSEAQIDLLSRASFDMGVCVRMFYTSEWSGAYSWLLPTVLRDDFGLKDARSIIKPSVDYFEKLIYAQTRCSEPVLLGISGTAGGHQVVAVGYGEDTEGTKYTRIFLGWGGSKDAWYALPEIDCKIDSVGNPTSEKFTVIDEIGTMLGVTDETMPLYGRVTNADGAGVADAEIYIPKVNARIVADANGFWGARFNPNDFTATGNEIICYTNNAIACKMTFNVGEYVKTGNSECSTTLYGESFDYYLSNAQSLFNALPGAIDFVTDGVVEEETFEWNYVIDNGQVIITYADYYAGSLTGDLTVPSEIEGKPVVSVGANAFYNCTNIVSILIPDSVTAIGDKAFYHCRRISDINLSEKIENIGYLAFGECYNMQSVFVDDNNAVYKDIDGVLFDKSGETLITYPSGRIEGGTYLTEYKVPEGVKHLAPAAFRCCAYLYRVLLPETLETIGDYAFLHISEFYYGYGYDIAVTIPDNVKSIGKNVFKDCRNLTGVSVLWGLRAYKEQFINETGVDLVTVRDATSNGVSCSWLDYYPDILAEAGGSYSEASKMPAKNGKSVKDCYIAGISPTDPKAEFTAQIEFEDGKPVIKYSPDLGDTRNYIIEGKTSLNDSDWVSPITDLHRFFRVRVELPE